MPDPLVIQCAITGSIDPDPERRPNLPSTPAAIVASALEAWRAGAAVVHLHAREPDGTPTQDREAYRLLVEALEAEGCEAIVNLSCGSAGGRAVRDERLGPLELAPGDGELRLRLDQLPRAALRGRPAVPAADGREVPRVRRAPGGRVLRHRARRPRAAAARRGPARRADGHAVRARRARQRRARERRDGRASAAHGPRRLALVGVRDRARAAAAERLLHPRRRPRAHRPGGQPLVSPRASARRTARSWSASSASRPSSTARSRRPPRRAPSWACTARADARPEAPGVSPCAAGPWPCRRRRRRCP